MKMENKQEPGKFLPAKAAVVLLAFGIALAVNFEIVENVAKIFAYFSEPAHRVFGLVLVVFGSAGLFLARIFARAIYAVCEIAFGLVTAWDGLDAVYANGLAKWTVIAGAAYLLVRGFDNLHESMGAPFKSKKLE